MGALCQWRNETKLSTSYFIFYGKTALRPISYEVKMLAAKMVKVKIPDTDTNSYYDVSHGFKKLEERLNVLRSMDIHFLKPKSTF